MKYSFVPWIALGISLAVTTIVWVTILDLDNQSQKVEFVSLTQKMSTQIQDKLFVHEQVLLSFKGLFLASYEVEPEEFTNFFNSQKITDRFPDNQGVGYNEYIFGENKKNELIKKLSEYGLDYTIFPKGTRSVYVPVVYLEPQDFRNKQALGYDIYSEDVRRQAVDQAIKTGQTTLTEKIILVQETDEDVQNGFLMLLPVYHKDDGKDTSELKGFVYSVFRMNDFVEGVLDKHLFEYVELKIYDGSRDSENLFFESNYVEPDNVGSIFSKSSTVDFMNKRWILDFHGSLPPESQNSQNIWMFVPIIGYGMSFLLFFTFFFFSKNIQLTEKMAKREKIAIIGELSSRFAHDIRNPLSNIQMAVELLQKKKDIVSNRSSEDKFQIITKNLDRISHQVNDVLDFVRTHQLEKKELSMLVCLSESVSTMYIPKNIKINLPNEDVSIYGDSSSLQIVCKNLILNAIQAIGNQEGNITIRFDEESEYTIMEIEDSGPGFPESKISEIFEPLVTTKQKGIGLGLVSCKNIIENHDGTITAKNNPTTFTIRLPKK
jgi:signal transduction histidine kinase